MFNFSLKWGGLLSLIGFVWVVMEFLLGFHSEKIAQHSTLTNLVLLPVMLVLHLALLEFKRITGPKTAFKHMMIAAISITGVTVVLIPFLQWIFFTLINPDFFLNFKNFVVSTGKMTPQAAEGYFNLPNYLTMSVVASVLTNLVVAAILSSLILRQNKFFSKD
jgi:hypothetical protein